jgi:hypothetical protein
MIMNYRGISLQKVKGQWLTCGSWVHWSADSVKAKGRAGSGPALPSWAREVLRLCGRFYVVGPRERSVLVG